MFIYFRHNHGEHAVLGSTYVLTSLLKNPNAEDFLAYIAQGIINAYTFEDNAAFQVPI